MYKNFIMRERRRLSACQPALKLAMRIGLFNIILMIACSQLLMAHHTEAQSLSDIQVSLELRNEGVRSLFRKIEKQTSLRFAFMENQISGGNRLNLTKGSYRVAEVLSNVLSPLELTYISSGSVVYIVRKTSSQKIDSHAEGAQESVFAHPKQPVLPLVKGRVSDERGEALPGVNVVVKGTSKGTTTNGSGFFELEVPDSKALLVFSFCRLPE